MLILILHIILQYTYWTATCTACYKDKVKVQYEYITNIENARIGICRAATLTTNERKH